MTRDEVVMKQLRDALVALVHPHTGHLMHAADACTGECQAVRDALQASAPECPHCEGAGEVFNEGTCSWCEGSRRWAPEVMR